MYPSLLNSKLAYRLLLAWRKFTQFQFFYRFLHTRAGTAIAHLSHYNSVRHTSGSVKNSAS